jgi:hypothetical protein
VREREGRTYGGGCVANVLLMCVGGRGGPMVAPHLLGSLQLITTRFRGEDLKEQPSSTRFSRTNQY